MHRTIKEATVKRYHYDSHNQLRQHLRNFVAAYNFSGASLPWPDDLRRVLAPMVEN